MRKILMFIAACTFAAHAMAEFVAQFRLKDLS